MSNIAMPTVFANRVPDQFQPAVELFKKRLLARFPELDVHHDAAEPNPPRPNHGLIVFDHLELNKRYFSVCKSALENHKPVLLVSVDEYGTLRDHRLLGEETIQKIIVTDKPVETCLAVAEFVKQVTQRAHKETSTSSGKISQPDEEQVSQAADDEEAQSLSLDYSSGLCS
jgi:hypothetical protein